MPSAKGLLLSAIGRLVLRDARITAVRELAPHVRELRLEGAALRDVAWTPGDKIQVLLPSRDVRTYTPVVWDGEHGTTELVVFDHGASPGAAWSRRVAVGDPCRFVGPQRSVHRQRDRPAVLFGDETSYGVAAALSGAPGLSGVLEVGAREDAETVLAARSLAAFSAVTRLPGDHHLTDVVARLQQLLREPAELLLTGRAQSIQAVQARLRHAGIRNRGANKAYWSVGKAGLD